MDSEHRHELKENDLQHFFENFGEWRKKHGTTTLLIIAAFILAIVGYNLYQNIQTTSHDNAWDELSITSSPTSYRQVASTHNVGAVPLLASLWAGDANLQAAVTPAEDAAETDADQQLLAAQEDYQRTLSMSSEPVFRVNALLGLAAIAETQNNFEAAQAHYEQAITEAGDTYPTLTARAEQRIAMLERLQEPVVFAPAPPPEVEESAAEQEAETATDATAPTETPAP